ncbi:MAG: nuclear transport factor 2 family protein [Desulfobacteraceae bacterium]|nr:MAG: nuclear transport factor 2 family protein [Desulfobacteraceae bacterium]
MRKLFLVFIAMMISGGCASLNITETRDEQLQTAYDNLMEKQAVKETITLLFISTDNRDWHKVKDLFAPEVRFDMTSLAGGEPVTLKPGDIVDAWDKGLKPIKAIHHQAGNFLITFDDGGATAFCYGIASHYLPNKTHMNTRTFVGSYDFHLVRINGKWKIDQFKFNLKYLDGNLNLESS